MTKDEALTLEALKYAASKGYGRIVRENSAPFTIKEALAQPVQEPVSFPCCGYTDANAIRWNQFNGVVQCHMCGQVYTVAQPAQEPVARVSGTYGGRFVYDPINPAMVLPVGMALYSSPQHTATWVGLTDEEIKEIIGTWGDTPVKGYTRKLFDQIEAKLRSKNT